MLDCEVKSSWSQFIEFVEERCSGAEFENWIAPIKLIESGINEVILEVPTCAKIDSTAGACFKGSLVG